MLKVQSSQTQNSKFLIQELNPGQMVLFVFGASAILKELRRPERPCRGNTEQEIFSELRYGKLSNVNIRLQIHLRFGFALLYVKQKVLLFISFWNSRKCVYFFLFTTHFFHYEWIQMRIQKLNSAYRSRDVSLSDHIWSRSHREAKKATHGLRTQSVVSPCGCTVMLMLHQFCRDILQISEQKYQVNLCSCRRHVGVKVLKLYIQYVYLYI